MHSGRQRRHPSLVQPPAHLAGVLGHAQRLVQRPALQVHHGCWLAGLLWGEGLLERAAVEPAASGAGGASGRERRAAAVSQPAATCVAPASLPGPRRYHAAPRQLRRPPRQPCTPGDVRTGRRAALGGGWLSEGVLGAACDLSECRGGREEAAMRPQTCLLRVLLRSLRAFGRNLGVPRPAAPSSSTTARSETLGSRRLFECATCLLPRSCPSLPASAAAAALRPRPRRCVPPTGSTRAAPGSRCGAGGRHQASRPPPQQQPRPRPSSSSPRWAGAGASQPGCVGC